MRRIYLIDCPGIVPASAQDAETTKVLKGVVRVENLSSPSEHIPALLARVRPVYLTRTYDLPPNPAGEDAPWEAEKFLEILARKSGKLLKGGEPDRETVSKMVLNDWIRGKIPFFVRPPERELDAPVPERKDKKGKGREKTVLGVTQEVKKIPVVTKFLASDRAEAEGAVEVPASAEQEAELAVDEAAEEESGDDDDDDVEAGDAAEDDEAPLEWDDLYGAVETAASSSKAGKLMFQRLMCFLSLTQTCSRNIKSSIIKTTCSACPAVR